MIPDEFFVTFCNHIHVLLIRLKNNECSNLEVNEDILNEVSKRSMIYAKECLTPLCEKYHVELSQAEQVLFAIYLQTGLREE